MTSHLVAVDIGGSKIALMARELGTRRLVQARKAATPAEDGVEAVLQIIDEQLRATVGERGRPRALGVAVPGQVDRDGLVLHAGNLSGWVNVPLRRLLEDRYEVPVFVEGDANCGALGERWYGAARGMRDFAFVALGTGVGVGLFVGGALHRGAHFAAGEAGDLMFPDPERDEPPKLGEVVGKRAIAAEVKRATGKKMSAADVLARAPRSPKLERATREVVEHLSTLVIALSALLDPEAILFGGGTSKAGEALLGRVRERVASRYVLRASLLAAGLGTRSQLYGALRGAEELVRRPRRSRTRSRPPRVRAPAASEDVIRERSPV